MNMNMIMKTKTLRAARLDPNPDKAFSESKSSRRLFLVTSAGVVVAMELPLAALAAEQNLQASLRNSSNINGNGSKRILLGMALVWSLHAHAAVC